MAMTEYLLGLDQGSSYSKAVLVDPKGKILRQAARPLKTFRSKTGWVEHDPISLLQSQLGAVEQLLQSVNKKKTKIAGVGIANQRSTLMVWDKHSGRPLVPAISWQDLRAARMIHRWEDDRKWIRSRTGLMLTPYYAALKLRWLLEHVKGLRAKAEKGKCLFGTVNSYLIWHLTKGEVHATDPTNAARMLLMNLQSLSWDPDLLKLFNIPATPLPAIFPTVADYGMANLSGMKIPIKGSIGDQQAGLIGIGAVNRGEVLVNYGTGGFLLFNVGSKPILIPGLLTSLAWTTLDKRAYVVEGTINAVGALFDWLKEIGLLRSPTEIDRLVKSSHPSSIEELYLIPSLSGLGAPHWLSEARTAIFGIGPATRREDLVRAAIEGVAFLIKDIAEVIRKDGRVPIRAMMASGGGSKLRSLIQAQADLLGHPINRTHIAEATALGSALLAGVGCGWWKTPSSVPRMTKGEIFRPRLAKTERDQRYEKWKKSIKAIRLFVQ